MNKQLLDLFRKPSADMLALTELEEARRQLLAAHTALEYAVSMVEYNTKRVKRLTARVSEVAQ